MTPLLAQHAARSTLSREETLLALRRGLEQPDNPSALLPALIGALAIAAIVLLYRLLRARRAAARPFSYLRHAAHLAGLSPADLHDLQVVGTLARLPHPTAMLLCPTALAHAARLAAAAAPDIARDERLERIGRKLFGKGWAGGA